MLQIPVMYPQFFLTVSQRIIWPVSYPQRDRRDDDWNSWQEAEIQNAVNQTKSYISPW